MKFTNLSLVLLVSAFSFSAMADIPVVTPNSPQEEVAMSAADVYSVTNLKLGGFVYKVVQMDSKLNGDISATTFIIVGEGSVGGEAGYEAAFQITPSDEAISMVSAQAKSGRINLVLTDVNGKRMQKSYLYDRASKTLKVK